MKIIRTIFESYLLILTTALVVALALPHVGQIFSPYTTVFLQIIFFLSALKLDLRSTLKDAKNIKPILLVNLYMLILLPALTYGLAEIFVPQFALPLLLLAAMPAGMTTMLLTEMVGGSVGLALILTMTTSLLSPITIPLVMKLLAGATVAVPVLDMFLKLVNVIAIPFILAQIVRHFFHERIQSAFPAFKSISTLLLGLLILGIVSKESEQIVAHIGTFVPALVVLFVFFFLHHLVGYYGIPNLTHSDRLATTVSQVYMNFTLAIFLASTYFPEPTILIPVILAVFPWSICIIPFKAIANRSA
jgi:BASS family bile acid:Na+ symporter